jgi:hypothetical protein
LARAAKAAELDSVTAVTVAAAVTAAVPATLTSVVVVFPVTVTVPSVVFELLVACEAVWVTDTVVPPVTAIAPAERSPVPLIVSVIETAPVGAVAAPTVIALAPVVVEATLTDVPPSIPIAAAP